MTAAALEPALLLAELDAAGFALAVAGDRLTVSPASKLNPGQREGIVRWKADLIALLAEREALDREVLARPPPLSRVGWVVVPEPRGKHGRVGPDVQRAGGGPSPAGTATGPPGRLY
jgi:hypothetical protein